MGSIALKWRIMSKPFRIYTQSGKNIKNRKAVYWKNKIQLEKLTPKKKKRLKFTLKLWDTKERPIYKWED